MGDALDRFDKIPPRARWPKWVESLAELAWVAGYLDGEGCFQFRGLTQTTIDFDSIHPQTVSRFARLLGGGEGCYPRKENGKVRLRFRWYTSSDRARRIAALLTKHELLSIKGPEAEAVSLAKRFPSSTAQGAMLRKRAHKNKWAAYGPKEKHHDDDPTG